MDNFRQLGTAIVLVLLAHFYTPIFCQRPAAAPALPAAPAPIVEPHTPTTHILTGAERNEFRIESAGNEYLRIRSAQREVALNVILRAPDGREILKNNSNGRLEQLVFSALATDPGTYYLVLENPAKPTAPYNSFTITIEEQRTASPDDIKRVAMERTVLEAEQLRVQGSIESTIKAIQAYEATLPFWRQIGSRREEANILTTLGQLQASIGQTEKALLYLNQALSVWKTSGDLYQTASTFSAIGLIYNRLDKKLEALENFQE